MRLATFIGLLYVAWCINPTTFDLIKHQKEDMILINLVILFAGWADFRELFKNNKLWTNK